jgi:SP family arabinose:H+ symporter-like MFS transporter
LRLNSYIIKSSLVGALGGLLFGFDTAVIAGTTHALTSLFHLSPTQLGATVSIAVWGAVIGAMTSGVLGERMGGRKALRIMAALYIISALGCAFAWNWPSLLIFRFIGGVGVGGSSVLGPVYIAELAPAKWRGRLVGMFQINVVIGILLAYLSNSIIASLHLGLTQWRWEFGVAALPAMMFGAFLFTIPMSSRCWSPRTVSTKPDRCWSCWAAHRAKQN